MKNIARRYNFFGPKIVKIRAILAIFRPFEAFAGVRYLFGCFEVDPGRKELEIYSVRDLYDSTINLSTIAKSQPRLNDPWSSSSKLIRIPSRFGRFLQVKAKITIGNNFEHLRTPKNCRNSSDSDDIWINWT